MHVQHVTSCMALRIEGANIPIPVCLFFAGRTGKKVSLQKSVRQLSFCNCRGKSRQPRTKLGDSERPTASETR